MEEVILGTHEKVAQMTGKVFYIYKKNYLQSFISVRQCDVSTNA